MNCTYCGQPAGFLRREHRACRERHQESLTAVPDAVRDAAVAGRAWRDVRGAVDERAGSGFIDRGRLPELVMDGVEQAVAHALDDDILNEEEEQRISGFLRSLEQAESGLTLPQDRFRETTDRLVKATVVRLVLNGKNPASRQRLVGASAFNFMKSETPVWYFTDVDYFVVHKQSHFSGRSAGVGFRVARGVYLRTGGFKGQRYTTEETKHADTGTLCVTTKHVYFAGGANRFRVRHDRIVTYTPMADGFSLTRDRANARPEMFRTGDGWFAYNIVTNARNVED